MAKSVKIEVTGGDTTAAGIEILKKVLGTADIHAIFAPRRISETGMVMPALITNPQHLDDVDLFSPAFMMNGAKLISRLTRKPAGRRIAAVLRPCEIRAFIELVKLKQGRREELLIIGADCPGAFSNRDFFAFLEKNKENPTGRFLESALSGKDNALSDPAPMSACRVCEHPVPEGADLRIALFGVDPGRELILQAGTEAGEQLLAALDGTETEEAPGRKQAVENRIAENIARLDEMLRATTSATDTPGKLSAYLAGCVNCYNCRVACPVCYCRECVFLTDVFDHEPVKYHEWAMRRGAVKLPADTVFYHITRLAHMSTACVGCGQCSNACPNDIPVFELFRTVARFTQPAFGYEAGRNPEEKPPLSVFHEDEYGEVVGIQ